jgi:hypothetical protein
MYDLKPEKSVSRMGKLILLMGAIVFSTRVMAGIEVVLLEQQYENCTIRVTHDATPSSTIGTLVFRSYILVNRIQHYCFVEADQVEHSLGEAVARYRSNTGLKPVTSILVGRIGRFPWVKAAWEIDGAQGSFTRLSHRQFNERVNRQDISGPFGHALRENGLSLGGASCEKLQFFENGAPMDALCWFEIESH